MVEEASGYCSVEIYMFFSYIDCYSNISQTFHHQRQFAKDKPLKKHLR